ncbi:MAG: hypothetical protein COT38_05095 [Candidatus Omnitrophica bacterium CG08_land_8_20_14_0_20_41_16]|uniref:NADH:quinone oxidoreductase/Mrp antiporter transmembrane domain-containing protein n=1 Tax=Candidatus Sherwoodlollariibacterium unditelluris TaxID=1974757 RepID=A0A2G9YLU9_9BACT|nr:MAG: hypothetical protein COX41_02625 [Candidatus Omnitrophica bacterium CG23_combo_of_CG06-09_8_20_14_all_41_10]PIS33476.1 MAG: hypothetical protein COT38_05095 [Candidatus Omnitrophica bacterium CG08_land_8_20_14_0_20_41_16]
MTTIILSFLILLPFISGIGLLFLGQHYELRKNLSRLVLSLSLFFSLFLGSHFSWSWQLLPKVSFALGLGHLARLVLIFANLFSFLICLYSKDYIKGKRGWFSWFLWLIAFANLEILAANFLTFNLAWGGSIVVFYALLRIDSRFSAKKTLTILGFSYICFIIGSCIYSSLNGSSSISSAARIVLDRPICWAAFLLMLIGALAELGCGPMHTWIPTASETAPVTVMAAVPASLGRLVGMYILSRLCLDFFVLNDFIIALLLIIGSFTIVFGVMLALAQHDLRKLLAYDAVSQTGYMVLGLGTASALGIIGAIFHMFNNAIYQSGLFLAGGAAEKQKKTFELDKLGGLARYMPLTFFAGLIFSLSISGIPPFNGFASKWMIYQGTLEGISSAPNLALRLVYLFALICAMFGSALTLASFMKFMHAIFLGQDNSQGKEKVTEPSRNMLIPLLILSGFCILLGVFSNIFIKKFIAPSFSFVFDYSGSWNSLLAASFIIISLVLGFIIWSSMRNKKVREDDFFVGGESNYGRPSFPATEFYKSIPEMPGLRKIYSFLKDERFDLYNILTGIFVLRWFRKPKK